MQVSYRPIAEAVARELARLGYEGLEPALTAIEDPRPWGVSTNVCFTLGARAAAARVEQEGAGLDKKAHKELAGRLAREAGIELARQVAAAIAPSLPGGIPFVDRVEAEGPYINFYYCPRELSRSVVGLVLAMGPRFGEGDPTGRKVMVEYAQPNTHKDFHVGHLRNASIGQAIANLLEFRGDEVYKATYLGDVGLHVAKAIWGEKQWRTNQAAHAEGFFRNIPDPQGDKLAFWGGLYSEATRYLAHLEAEHNASPPPAPSAAQAEPQNSRWQAAMHQVRTWLHYWENGNAEARAAWEESREDCDLAFRRIFAELDVSFHPDCWFYESTVDDTRMGQQAAAELLERGVAQIDDTPEYKGSLYVDLAEKTGNKRLGKMVIQRSDGTSLYQTKELALAKYKFDHFNIDESLYVVGSEQKLYFEQVFAILKLWGFPNADHCRHISYELVVLPEGKMSSREGTVVSYRELRDEALRRALEITREKGIAGDAEAVAKSIAIAAIKFTMLQVSGNQQIVFDFEQALSFDGRSAPYLQYAYARAGKLVEGCCGPEALEVPEQLDPAEIALARLLSQYPSAVRDAASRYEPASLCAYLFALANGFSAFYRDCRVLDAPEPWRGYRKALSQAFRHVLASGFALLALPLPEEM